MTPFLLALAEAVPDIPRYHTAIAEWLFAFVFILYLPKRNNKMYALITHVFWFLIILAFQLIAGTMPIEFWIFNMVAAVLIMFFYIYTTNKVNLYTAGYFCRNSIYNG